MKDLDKLLKQLNDDKDVNFKDKLKTILLANKYFIRKDNIFIKMKNVFKKPFVWLPMSGVVAVAVVIAILFQTSSAFIMNLPKIGKFNSMKVDRILAQADDYYKGFKKENKVHYRKIQMTFPESGADVVSEKELAQYPEEVREFYTSMSTGMIYELWTDDANKKAKMKMISAKTNKVMEEMILMGDDLDNMYMKNGIFMVGMMSLVSSESESYNVEAPNTYANQYEYEIKMLVKEEGFIEAEAKEMTRKDIEEKVFKSEIPYSCSWDYEIKLGELVKIPEAELQKRNNEYYETEAYKKCEAAFQESNEENEKEEAENDAKNDIQDNMEELLGFGETPFTEVTNQSEWKNIFKELKDSKYVKYEGEKKWEGMKVYVLSMEDDGEKTNYYFSTDNYTLRGMEAVDGRGKSLGKTVIWEDKYLSDKEDFSTKGYISMSDMEKAMETFQPLGIAYTELNERIFDEVGDLNLEDFGITAKTFEQKTINELNEVIRKYNPTVHDEYYKCNEVKFADDSYYKLTPAQIKAILVKAGIQDKDWAKLSNKDVNEKLVKAGYKPLFVENSVYTYSPEYVKANQFQMFKDLMETVREK